MVTLKENSPQLTHEGQFTSHGVYHPAVKCLLFLFITQLKVYIYICIFLYLISLFSFSLSFFQKDLPLPRKNSRWVLASLTPPSFLPPPSVFSLLSGESSRRKTVTPGEAAERDLCVLFGKLWGCSRGACGVDCVWTRRRSAGGMLGVCRSLIKARQELWTLSMVLKDILPFPVAQWPSLYLPSSSHCLVINLSLLHYLHLYLVGSSLPTLLF